MTIFLVGSGATDVPDQVWDEFVAEVKPRGNRVVIALLGAPDEEAPWLAEVSGPIIQRWPDAVVEPVFLFEETEWPASLDEAAGFIVGGGWTPGYLDYLVPRRPEVARAVRRGTPYLGLSAGAMLAAKHAIAGGWKHHGRVIAPEIAGEGLEELEIRDGLALIGSTIAVHADTWSVLGLPLAVLETGKVTGCAAIDEGTCLAVDSTSGQTRTIGRGRVTWLTKDGRKVLVRHESAG